MNHHQLFSAFCAAVFITTLYLFLCDIALTASGTVSPPLNIIKPKHR